MRLLSPSTREAIVKGTLSLLAQKDFAEVTTRSIAESASISEATLFRYFRRKEDLLGLILQEVAKGFLTELEHVTSLVDGHAEKLIALCRSHARWAARNRDLFALLQRECSYTGRKDQVCTDGIRRFHGIMRDILGGGVKDGVFRADLDVETALLAFWSVIHTVMMEDRLLRPKPADEGEFVAKAERFYQMYLRAIRAEGGAK
jgi:AcrR family transcriptional regulator